MSALYVFLVALVVASFVGTVYLRRAADRAWRRHQILEPMRRDLVRLQIQIADRLTPALQEMSRAVAAMAPAFKRLGEAIEKEAHR